jgi:hypothetical protein
MQQRFLIKPLLESYYDAGITASDETGGPKADRHSGHNQDQDWKQVLLLSPAPPFHQPILPRHKTGLIMQRSLICPESVVMLP